MSDLDGAVKSYYYWVSRCLAAEDKAEGKKNNWQELKDAEAERPIVDFGLIKENTNGTPN